MTILDHLTLPRRCRLHTNHILSTGNQATIFDARWKFPVSRTFLTCIWARLTRLRKLLLSVHRSIFVIASARPQSRLSSVCSVWLSPFHQVLSCTCFQQPHDPSGFIGCSFAKCPCKVPTPFCSLMPAWVEPLWSSNRKMWLGEGRRENARRHNFTNALFSRLILARSSWGRKTIWRKWTWKSMTKGEFELRRDGR